MFALKKVNTFDIGKHKELFFSCIKPRKNTLTIDFVIKNKVETLVT